MSQRTYTATDGHRSIPDLAAAGFWRTMWVGGLGVIATLVPIAIIGSLFVQSNEFLAGIAAACSLVAFVALLRWLSRAWVRVSDHLPLGLRLASVDEALALAWFWWASVTFATYGLALLADGRAAANPFVIALAWAILSPAFVRIGRGRFEARRTRP